MRAHSAHSTPQLTQLACWRARRGSTTAASSRRSSGSGRGRSSSTTPSTPAGRLAHAPLRLARSVVAAAAGGPPPDAEGPQRAARAPSPSPLARLRSGWERVRDAALYQYFKFRKDAFTDLQLIFLLNLTAIAAVTAAKVSLGESFEAAWLDYYQAALISVGESWPPDNAAFFDQVLAIALYLAGVLGFAIVLSIVEQSVLQVYDARVELGSPVLERDHILVLACCRSQSSLDRNMLLSKLESILNQLCAAYASSGGRTLVVLSQLKKTQMEALFAAALPPEARRGSRLVFRQGNPLKRSDLQLVAADEAAVVLVLADDAASPDASDSQVLRTLVLLDEFEVAAREEGRRRPVPGHVVAEIQTEDVVPLLNFMLVKPVLPLLPHRQNAARLALLVTRPVVAELTNSLWDATSRTAVFVHSFPQLAGHSIAEVALRFRSGVVLGVLEAASGLVLLNPPSDYRLSADEQLILLRPTAQKQSAVLPLPAPVDAPIGNFDPAAAITAQHSWQTLAPAMVTCSLASSGGDASAGSPVSSLAAAAVAAAASSLDPEADPDAEQQLADGQPPEAGDGAAAAAAVADGQQSSSSSLARKVAQLGGGEQLSKLKLLGQLSALREAEQLVQLAPPELVQAQEQAQEQEEAQEQAQAQGQQQLQGQQQQQQQEQQQSEQQRQRQQLPQLQQAQRLPQHQPRLPSGMAATLPDALADRLLAASDGRSARTAAAAAWAAEGARATVSQCVGGETNLGPALSAAERSDLIRAAARISTLQRQPNIRGCVRFNVEGMNMQLDRSAPVHLLLLGWGHSEFIVELLTALQTGQTALPPGSRLTCANTHSAAVVQAAADAAHAEAEAASRAQRGSVERLPLRHVRCNPLVRGEVARLDLASVKAAIVLCDRAWRSNGGLGSSSAQPAPAASLSALTGLSFEGGAVSPAVAAAALGIQALPEASDGGAATATAADAAGACVLALDALLLRAQLNLRSALAALGRERQVNIVCEQLGREPATRFEAPDRLPFGVTFNCASYTACLMSQLAVCPLMLLPRTFLSQVDSLIIDADVLTGVGDVVSFWQLMRRAQLLSFVLLGYYTLPQSASDPIEAVLCPTGRAREERRVWNEGDGRTRFIVLQDAAAAQSGPRPAGEASGGPQLAGAAAGAGAGAGGGPG